MRSMLELDEEKKLRRLRLSVSAGFHSFLCPSRLQNAEAYGRKPLYSRSVVARGPILMR